jgi:hypothetical protein
MMVGKHACVTLLCMLVVAADLLILFIAVK